MSVVTVSGLHLDGLQCCSRAFCAEWQAYLEEMALEWGCVCSCYLQQCSFTAGY